MTVQRMITNKTQLTVPSAVLACMLCAVAGCYTAEPNQAQIPVADPIEAPAEDTTLVSAAAEAVETTDPSDTPAEPTEPASAEPVPTEAAVIVSVPTIETATFGAGCFWCVEAVLEMLKGVESVESGYCNGQVPNPTYDEVCTGDTGHAEVVRVKFDPSVITFAELLEVFWSSHDPTTLNRQGADVGTQYRSGVYTHSEEQKKQAEAYRDKLDASGAFSRPIVTEITPAGKFYSAEGYHQDYFEQNGRAPYCRRVIQPKIDKVRKVFADKLQK